MLKSHFRTLKGKTLTVHLGGHRERNGGRQPSPFKDSVIFIDIDPLCPLAEVSCPCAMFLILLYLLYFVQNSILQTFYVCNKNVNFLNFV